MSMANTADHTRRGITAADQSLRLEAARQPTDIPRNVASNTMFVKNVRNTTVLPNHLMHANSKKRSRKLTTNNSTYGRTVELRRNGMYRDNVSMLMGLVTRCLSRRNSFIDEVAGPAMSRALLRLYSAIEHFRRYLSSASISHIGRSVTVVHR